MTTRGTWRCASRKFMAFARASASSQASDGADISCSVFESVVPTIRVARHDTIPSVWDQELVAKLLDAVDRNLPRGKRDFAILLLAARLGMRLGDIRTLRLDDLKWAAATIEIAQGKTSV